MKKRDQEILQNKPAVSVFKAVRQTRLLCGGMRSLLLFFILLFSVAFYSCRYEKPNLDKKEISDKTKDSLSYLYKYHYTLNKNFEVCSDTVMLAQLPFKDKFLMVNKGDRVVVADFMIQPSDTVDSVWVKVARDEKTQGWIHESMVVDNLVPVDFGSQAIFLFSHTHASYSLIVVAVVLAIFLLRVYLKKKLMLVYFNDINSVYPLMLCFLLAFSATIYESVQMFAPETWQHYYFNPTLSPFKVPLILSVFVLSLWAFIVIFLASLEDLFHQLSAPSAFLYLLGLAACCIFCYFFFIIATSYYVGYPTLLFFFYLLVKKINGRMTYKYRCGKCGALMKEKGECPSCGAVNQ
ncbi:hypothetical protein [uncultured Bacteroides sp.]|uniref:hypothetical protein n=1 Tax=uncultured Bacteroides sp. TaxID=162156 RepID=UPI002AAB27A7|nr:hypothetical protein [uncultured Bacteroides sp.]